MAAEAERLPADVLPTVRRWLPIVDYLRFPAVCTAWRSAARDRHNLPHLPRGPPWLFTISDDKTTLYGIDCLSNMGVPKVYMIPLPDHLHGCELFPSVGNHLLLEKRGSHSGIHLFNPFSPSSTPAACLPPSATLEPPPFLYPSFFQINGVAADSNSGIAFAILSLSSVNCRAAYIRLDCDGDNINPVGSWIDLSPLISDPFIQFATAVLYKAGLFCAVDYMGNKVVAFDFSSPPTVRLVDMTFNLPHFDSIPFPGDWCCYQSASLVNSGSSLFLVRWRIIFRPDGSEKRKEIHIYRLDDDAGDKQWVPVNSLGDCSFFIGRSHSISMSTVDFPELKSNRVYLPIDHCGRYDFNNLGRNPVYNLEDESWGVLYDVGSRIPTRRLEPSVSVWMIPRSVP